MKLTKKQLRRLIKEEIQKTLKEAWGPGGPTGAGWFEDEEDEEDAAPSGLGKETDDEMAALQKSFSDAGADALDSQENREMRQNLYNVQADVEEYIKQGEFDGARQHINAAYKSGAFGKNPKFAKAQWRRLRRMATNAKRKAARRAKPAMKPGESRFSVDPMGRLKGGDYSAAMEK